MSLCQPAFKRVLSTIPRNLIHFAPFPGRFLQTTNRSRSSNNGDGTVKKGMIDPKYNWRDIGWDQNCIHCSDSALLDDETHVETQLRREHYFEIAIMN